MAQGDAVPDAAAPAGKDGDATDVVADAEAAATDSGATDAAAPAPDRPGRTGGGGGPKPNSLFRATRIPLDHPGLVGRELGGVTSAPKGG